MIVLDLIQKYLTMFNDLVQKIASFIAGTLIGVMTLVILYMVYFRYVVNDTPYWSEEVARCMMLWMTFCVLPISYRIGSNVALDIVINKFRGRFLILFETFIHILILLFIINFFYQSLSFVQSGMGARAYSFDLQIGYIYLILPISFTYMFLVSIEHLLTRIKRFITPFDSYEKI
ncbi:uncharacterized protein METZ01_LOCUS111520 [marine metagenome]|uniref:Tripartite ATP-independent periplasmic transporters DctQ component domain-containing protein n=1 Tax=marine metagenome TaxID=408172 RepID=A0A381X1J8_9ZZZZ